MGANRTKLHSRAMTRVELVVVMAVSAILVVLLLPAFRGGRRDPGASISRVKMEMVALAMAIYQYQTAYGRFPVSSNATGSSDFTFGTYGTSDEALGITNASGYEANNSEVIAMLMDFDKFPNGQNTVNVDHVGNTNKIAFLAAKMTSSTNSPGVGPDYVYRDPWGHPYIITIDLNGDNKCRDAFYRLTSVSETASALGSHAYLTRPSPPPYSSDDARDSFEVPGAVIVWSLGPDGKADKSQKASEGVNKDNITSW